MKKQGENASEKKTGSVVLDLDKVKTTKITVNDFIQLRERYESIKDEPEKGFFLGIADYVKHIAEHPGLDAIAASIKEQQRADEKKITVIEKKLYKEIKGVEKELYEMVRKNDLNTTEIKESIDHYEGIKDGRVQSSATMEEALYGGLAGIIMKIFASEHKELVRKYLTTYPDNDNISGYTFAPSYPQYKEELHNFRELRKTSLWGSWDKLVLVYLVVHKHKEELRGLDPIENVWKRLNFMGLRGEMVKIIDGKKDHRIEFVQEDYKIHLRRVHEYFVKKSGGEELEKMSENLAHYIKDIAPAFTLPTRFIEDMRQATQIASNFAEQYKKATTMVVEPIRQVSQWGDQLREMAKKASLVQEDFDEKLDLLHSIPSQLENYTPRLAPLNIELPEHTTNELLVELINEVRELRSDFRALLNGDANNQTQQWRGVASVEVKLPSVRFMKKELTRIKKVRKLGNLEAALFKELYRFEAREVEELKRVVNTNNIASLKHSLCQKIKKEHYQIKTSRGGGFGKSTYQMHIRQVTEKIVSEN